MIFSGTAGHYRCRNCGHELTVASPTSLIPAIATIGFAAAIWKTTLERWIPRFWPALCCSFGVALGTFVLLVLIMEVVTRIMHRRCSQCQGELELRSTGFYDFNSTPLPKEMFIYVAVVLIPIAIIPLVRQ